ncbi:hypothetical protein N5C10_11350 [Acinetobacter johnsonii]|uniref:Uncharacterized protein n=1 Tax=Acinetobacter johnsonii TaxID=40214 RepID=A0AA42MVP8_ACIJO|nr:hypothetical protein [Acinetobacter johnsonii]MDH0969821.1 hypothetical protein [Acinetobacter johnsonii]
MSNKKTHITLSFVKGLIKQLSDPYADEALKDFKQYCFDIPSGKQLFFRDLKLIGFAIRATRHSLVYTVEKKMIYAELSGDFPLGDSRQPTYKSLRPFDLVS